MAGNSHAPTPAWSPLASYRTSYRQLAKMMNFGMAGGMAAPRYAGDNASSTIELVTKMHRAIEQSLKGGK